jgi:hypothetical protein
MTPISFMHNVPAIDPLRKIPLRSPEILQGYFLWNSLTLNQYPGFCTRLGFALI